MRPSRIVTRRDRELGSCEVRRRVARRAWANPAGPVAVTQRGGCRAGVGLTDADLLSGADARVELGNEAVEGVGEFGLVLVGVSVDELDHLAIADGGLLILPAGFVDHAQSIVAVVNIREAYEQIPRGCLGFVELAGLHQANDGIGGIRELNGFLRLVLPLQHRREGGVLFLLFHLVFAGCFSGGGGIAFELRQISSLVLRQATLLVFLPAATGT